MEVLKVKISDVKTNPKNPRLIKDEKFKKLVKSIIEFPQMLELRPIVVDENNIVLGGNMRLKACKEVGLKEVFIVRANDLTDEQKDEFIVKDNVGFGEWDWDMLANEWDENKLNDWGLDVPKTNDLNEQDLFDIEIPFYTPSSITPNIIELAYLDRTKELVNKIEKLEIEKELKEILIARASFFTDFNFSKIADFYSKQNKEVKEIFEELGMVILAPKDALDKGFIELSNFILEL